MAQIYNVMVKYDSSGDFILEERGMLRKLLPIKFRVLCKIMAQQAAKECPGVAHYAFYDRQKRDIAITENIKDITKKISVA